MSFEIINIPDGDLTFSRTWRESESVYWMERLRKEIEWEQHRIKIFGQWVDCPRLSAWYGDPGAMYSYSGLSLTPKAWTPTLLEVRNQLAETIERPFNSVLLNLYRNGNDSMGWHSDDEWELGLNPVIASISLGDSRMMKFRHRSDPEVSKFALELSTGSLLIMAGTTQKFWQHEIPKTKKSVGERLNLTFRFVQGR
jgi:alkylated DNA repair dioxygenase AlkB